MKISINISSQVPETKQDYKRPCLKDKVDDYIRCVEANDIDSKYEWNYLKRLYERLLKYKPTEETGLILKNLESLFEKYANKDHDNAVQLDAQTMHKYNNEDE